MKGNGNVDDVHNNDNSTGSDGEGDGDGGYNLHDLFITRDYVSTIVAIPTVTAAVAATVDCSARPHQQQDDENYKATDTLSIEIFHSNAACTDPDLTGQVLWPISIVLSSYIAKTLRPLFQQQQQQQQQQKQNEVVDHHIGGLSSSATATTTIIELGCGGTALPSITSYYCSNTATTTTSVLATDGNDNVVFDLLRRNIHHHCNQQLRQEGINETPSKTKGTLRCQQLIWGNRSHIQSIRKTVATTTTTTKKKRTQAFDYILAADVIQWPAVLEPLLHTVLALMYPTYDDDDDDDESGHAQQQQQQQQSHPMTIVSSQSKFILAIVIRSTMIYQQFIHLATNMGFTIRIIDPIEYSSDDILAISATDTDKNKITNSSIHSTQILELTYQQPFTNVPILLQQQQHDDRDNMLVGTSYEHTTFLPC